MQSKHTFHQFSNNKENCSEILFFQINNIEIIVLEIIIIIKRFINTIIMCGEIIINFMLMQCIINLRINVLN